MQSLWNLIFGEGWLANVASYLTITTAILIGGSLAMMLLTWIERRGLAYFQDRKGPNRVGPFGLFQPIAEAIKTITKEDITPRDADRWVHFLGPVVILASTVMAFAVLPWGNLIPVDINVGVLYIIAVSALHTVGILMAGWASNNKFALLGGMRGVAQAISYEIPQVMSLVAIVMLVGSMSVVDVIQNQSGFFGLAWHIFTPVGLLAFIIFWIASLAEGERPPFDNPEAESELVAGYMTEYGGMKFAVLFLANYMTNFAICAVTAGVFLGGGNGPGSNIPILGTLLSVFYFLGKTFSLFFLMVWIRAVVPRLRIDELMSFAWKFLLPLALVNIFSTSIWIAITKWGAQQGVGFVEGLGTPDSVLRVLVAYIVTGVINVVAFLLVARLNATRGSQAYQGAPTAV
jgi:NADH-quinone oxidoreductase subunit H